MNRRCALTVGLVSLSGAAWLAFAATPEVGDRGAIDTTLDTLHAAAATADEAVYFDLYTPDAVFLGTDATERWTLEEFKAYAMPYFTTRESAWTYQPIERHVSVGAGGDVAWFDERLTNAKWGECRGSGVLVKDAGRWRIAQYNLTVPIPNDLLPTVAGMIREHGAGASKAE
jgi:hypothetical protein